MGLESLAKGTSIKQRFAILNKYYSNQMLNEERSKLEIIRHGVKDRRQLRKKDSKIS
ncbi:hypothetical protein [Enterococcus rivorum]|uniref:hypothetical protein n=1 Tax=Enterococcus rivorum TaxID=762845 RepID=UPI0036443853